MNGTRRGADPPRRACAGARPNGAGKPIARLKTVAAQDLYRRERVLNAFAKPGFKLIGRVQATLSVRGRA